MTTIRSCLQLLLKMLNSFFAMFGFAFILYAVFIINISTHPLSSSSWFGYTIFGFGVILCSITFWGHIAAETANGFCLYCYLVFIFLLLMLEGAVTTDIFLNPNWEKDFPQDPSGNLHELKDFIKENTDFCKWVGLAILSVEGLCVFLALILLAFGPHKKENPSEVKYTQEEVPLLKNYSNQSSYVEKQVNMRPLHSSITW